MSPLKWSTTPWWVGAALSPVWYVAYSALLTVQAPARVVNLVAPVAPLIQVAGVVLAIAWAGPAMVLPVMLLWNKSPRLRRRRSFQISLSPRFGALVVLLAWVAPFAAQPMWALQRLGADACASRAQKVVEALERYRSDEGKYPASLNDLVPRYLSSVPVPGPIAYPRFEYSRANSKTKYAGYELAVPMLHGASADRLIYWPNQIYPERIYSGGVDVRGTWAYVSE